MHHQAVLARWRSCIQSQMVCERLGLDKSMFLIFLEDLQRKAHYRNCENYLNSCVLVWALSKTALVDTQFSIVITQGNDTIQE